MISHPDQMPSQGVSIDSAAFAIRLDAVRKLPPLQRVRTLAQTLPAASDEEREFLASDLLECAVLPDAQIASPISPRRIAAALGALVSPACADDALREIVGHWQFVPPTVRRAAWAVGRGRWGEIVGELVRSEQACDRAAVAELLGEVPEGKLVRTLALLLADPERSVGDAAERSLMGLAMAVAGPIEPAQLGDDLEPFAGAPIDQTLLKGASTEIERTIADSAYTYADHRRNGPLLGALMLIHDRPNPNPHQARLRRLLTHTGNESHAALCGVLRRSRSPLLRRRALRWMTNKAVASSAIERIASARSALEHELVLTDAHLAEHPVRRARLAMVRVPTRKKDKLVELTAGGPLPDGRMLGQLDEEARRGLTRFSGAFELDRATRRLVLAPCLSDPCAQVRLMGLACADAADRSDFAFDDEQTIARSAVLGWSPAGSGRVPTQPLNGAHAQRARLASVLTRSPHAQVRRVAREDAARGNPWNASSPMSRLAARRWLEADPAAFVEQLHKRMRHSDGSMRTNAILLARRLGLVERFELELIRLASDRLAEGTAARTTATALAALGDSTSESAKRIVREAMDAADSRVRANAVEARVEQTDGSRDASTYGELVELKADRAHRVRANALRALLVPITPENKPQTRIFEPTAVEAFASMLTDDRSSHRLAGAWLAERRLTGRGASELGQSWADLAGLVAKLAEDDPVEQVRTRARRCARRMLAEMRHKPEQELIGAE